MVAGKSRNEEAVRSGSESPPTNEGQCSNGETAMTGQQAENAALQATEHWAPILDAMSDPVAILDTQHRIVQANKAMAQRLGVTQDECVGSYCYTCVHGADEPLATCPLSKLLRDGREHTEEVHEELLGGDFLMSVSPLFDPDGRLAGAVYVARDITEQKRANEALRESEKQFRLFYEHSPLGYQSLDEQGRFLEVNPAWLATLGYTRDEVIGRWFGDFLAPDYVERFKKNFPIFKASGEVQGALFEIVRKDGSRRTVEFDGKIGYDDDGNFAQTHCVMRDITERKRAEKRLHFLTSAVEQSSEGIAVVDLEGNLLFVNDAFAGMHGYTLEELAGKHLSVFHVPEQIPSVDTANRQVQETGSFSGEIWHARRDGTVFPTWMQNSILRDDAGNPVGVIGTVRDITEQKQVEAALAGAKEAAESANRAKSEFLANMSHEIRTPMSSILGFTDLLMAHEVPLGERREHLQTIRRNSENLLTILNDILDLSKIEAGKTELELTECPPQEIVEEVRSLMQVRANEKHLDLDVNFDFPLPRTIRTDPVRLRQILINLVGNAIKFTEKGGVRITVGGCRAEGLGTQVRFEVADTGIGMTSEEMAQIFRDFTQLDTSHARRFGGTGLGLSISRKFAEMLGGEIQVHSEPGRGSTFILSIDLGSLENVPILQTAEEETAVVKEPTGPDSDQEIQGRVLLAEDDSDVRRAICLAVELSGVQVETAENGRTACQKALGSKVEGRPYDLILMDIQMPEMDGYEATRCLRQEGWEGPIVALTAHMMAGDHEKCLHAGCNDYLSKPATRANLLDMVDRYLSAPRAPAPFFQ